MKNQAWLYCDGVEEHVTMGDGGAGVIFGVGFVLVLFGLAMAITIAIKVVDDYLTARHLRRVAWSDFVDSVDQDLRAARADWVSRVFAI